MDYHQAAKVDPAYCDVYQRIKRMGYFVTLTNDNPDYEVTPHWSIQARHWTDFGRGGCGFGETPLEAVRMLERCIVDGPDTALGLDGNDPNATARVE